MAVLLASRRSRGERTAAARVYRALARAAVVAYPLLGLARISAGRGSRQQHGPPPATGRRIEDRLFQLSR
ncbi:MAG: hypothetical protein ACLQDY_07750 [Streptosporangiaceae bacterium]